MSDNVVNITIRIAGRAYPVKIDKGDEPSVRRLERELNDKIQFYKTEYQGVDHLDSLYMTLLTYAFDLHKCKTGKQPASQVNEKLDILDSLLSEMV